MRKAESWSAELLLTSLRAEASSTTWPKMPAWFDQVKPAFFTHTNTHTAREKQRQAGNICQEPRCGPHFAQRVAPGQ